ncbi:MAG: hypothetical protein BWX73_00399 [Lentisphaerae bacterium ADurb.Bin082]|nr:MAG: hypothetical protein BWX73_00399 [Lentisphaerae bacterium ADurb.Bin082]
MLGHFGLRKLAVLADHEQFPVFFEQGQSFRQRQIRRSVVCQYGDLAGGEGEGVCAAGRERGRFRPEVATANGWLTGEQVSADGDDGGLGLVSDVDQEQADAVRGVKGPGDNRRPFPGALALV